MDTTAPTRWLTIKEASAYTRLSTATLRRAMRHGQLRAFRLQKAVRFRAQDIDTWLTAKPVEVR